MVDHGAEVARPNIRIIQCYGKLKDAFSFLFIPLESQLSIDLLNDSTFRGRSNRFIVEQIGHTAKRGTSR